MTAVKFLPIVKNSELTVWMETPKHLYSQGNVGIPLLGPQLKEAGVQQSIKFVLNRCVAVKVSEEYLNAWNNLNVSLDMCQIDEDPYNILNLIWEK